MRRTLVSLALMASGLALGGCVQAERPVPVASLPAPPDARYAALQAEPFPVVAIDTARIKPGYLRTEVDYPTAEAPGTIVIDTTVRHLYLVQDGGRAMRYGVGVGKEGMAWSGTATIGAMRSWPDWYPPSEMIGRRPDIQPLLQPLQGGMGMPGGVGNPLGARAMYLYRDGKDTLYRIHGTEEPYTMGEAVSSGCIRMINQDALDLFSRVTVGTRVVVLPDASAPALASVPAPAYRAAPDYRSTPVRMPGPAYEPSYREFDEYVLDTQG